MKKIIAIAASALLFALPALAADKTSTGHGTYEFNKQCALGVALGKNVACDTAYTESTTWTDPKTHKEYCFSSAEMKTKFASDITGNLTKAEKNWTEMHAAAHTNKTVH